MVTFCNIDVKDALIESKADLNESSRSNLRLNRIPRDVEFHDVTEKSLFQCLSAEFSFIALKIAKTS